MNLKENKLMPIVVSVVISFLGVALLSYAATTISTNVDTGGTLNANGATTLNGNVTLGDAAADVIRSVGGFQASSTALFGGASTFYATQTLSGVGLVLGSSATDLSGSAGMIYYNSGSKVIRMNDGNDWFTVGTSTGGLSLSGTQIRLSSLNYGAVLGTTTQQGPSVMTLEATTTTAVPLTLVGFASQTGKTFQIRNASSANLLYVDSGGGLFGSSTLQMDGATRLYGALTVDGNITSGDAVGDTLTVNAGTVAMGNRATTTIQNNLINAWSIATSTSITPTLTINTLSDAAGRVGVGTTSPGYEFSVTGDGYFTGNVLADGDLTIAGGDMTITNRATTTIPNNVINAWSIATSTSITPTLTINTLNDASGRVGVGTTSPGYEFSVTGDGYFTGNISADGNLIVGGNETSGDAIGDTLTINSGTVAMGNRATTTIQNNLINAWSIATSTSITPTLTISTSNNALGRVGIGTTSPHVALGVNGTTTSSAGMIIGTSKVNQIIFGTATIDPNDGPLGNNGTTTTFTATGVESGDTVLVTPANLPAGMYLVSASSTASNTVQVTIGSSTTTAPSVTSYAGWSWLSIR